MALESSFESWLDDKLGELKQQAKTKFQRWTGKGEEEETADVHSEPSQQPPRKYQPLNTDDLVFTESEEDSDLEWHRSEKEEREWNSAEYHYTMTSHGPPPAVTNVNGNGSRLSSDYYTFVFNDDQEDASANPAPTLPTNHVTARERVAQILRETELPDVTTIPSTATRKLRSIRGGSKHNQQQPIYKALGSLGGGNDLDWLDEDERLSIGSNRDDGDGKSVDSDVLDAEGSRWQDSRAENTFSKLRPHSDTSPTIYADPQGRALLPMETVEMTMTDDEDEDILNLEIDRRSDMPDGDTAPIVTLDQAELQLKQQWRNKRMKVIGIAGGTTLLIVAVVVVVVVVVRSVTSA